MSNRYRRATSAPRLELADGVLRLSWSEGQSVAIELENWPTLVDEGNRLVAFANAIGPKSPVSPKWSPDDDRRLRDLWCRNSSMDALIDALDRNSSQIERRLFDLGIIASRRELRAR